MSRHSRRTEGPQKLTLTAPQMSLWLADHVSAIAAEESAGDICAEIKRCIDEIERCINRPVPDRYLGPCPTLLTDGYGQRVCGTELTAPRAADTVQCPVCGTTHRTAALHEEQMRRTDEMSFTISDLHRLILPINREYVPLRTLQHWVARNLLVPTGWVDAEPRFLLADVRALRNRKPQAKPTGAAAHKRRA